MFWSCQSKEATQSHEIFLLTKKTSCIRYLTHIPSTHTPAISATIHIQTIIISFPFRSHQPPIAVAEKGTIPSKSSSHLIFLHLSRATQIRSRNLAEPRTGRPSKGRRERQANK